MIKATLMILWVIAWAAAFLVSIVRFTDFGRADLQAWIYAVLCVLSLAWVIDSSVKYEQENPCAEYETRLQYNAATKTTMPMRVCSLRGEWVTDGMQP